jgi:hypothetical protein
MSTQLTVLRAPTYQAFVKLMELQGPPTQNLDAATLSARLVEYQTASLHVLGSILQLTSDQRITAFSEINNTGIAILIPSVYFTLLTDPGVAANYLSQASAPQTPFASPPALVMGFPGAPWLNLAQPGAGGILSGATTTSLWPGGANAKDIWTGDLAGNLGKLSAALFTNFGTANTQIETNPAATRTVKYLASKGWPVHVVSEIVADSLAVPPPSSWSLTTWAKAFALVGAITGAAALIAASGGLVLTAAFLSGATAGAGIDATGFAFVDSLNNTSQATSTNITVDVPEGAITVSMSPDGGISCAQQTGSDAAGGGMPEEDLHAYPEL